MRIYRYWTKRTEDVAGTQMTFFGHSNESEADAESLIERKIAWCRRWRDPDADISPEEAAEQDAFFAGGKIGAEYEVPIREEIVETLDDSNVITRNRYGALVLNSIDHSFVDIDTISPSLGDYFGMIFGRKIPDVKTRILDMIHTESAKDVFRDVKFRVYETARGIRLLICAPLMPANSFPVQRILYQFHADKLYATLCAKQNCFRARLTPKPARIRMRTLRSFPFPCEPEIKAARAGWVAEYNSKSENYAVCRLLEELGGSYSSPVVDYHDRLCRVGTHLPLA